MTTLIAQYNSEGCQGRCDARCHEAHEPECHCICGGVNHGVGADQALENVRAYTRDQLEAIRAKGGYVPDDLRQALLL